MSYIQPNTDIYILSNIPLNKGYEHTVYYSDKNSQAQGFMKYKKHHLTNYSYQRALLGTIKVELKYEQLIDCNYMMFKNTNFENKWFYAFITGIGYISNDVTAIYYEIDVMQTWCYDYKFMPTFVERQHSTNDELYENLQAEGLNIGSESYNYRQHEENLKSTSFCLSIASEVTGTIAPVTKIGGYYGGIYNGLYVYTCSTSAQVSDLVTKINNQGLGDSVVSFQATPTANTSGEFTTCEIQETDNFQGYKPRNKKLLTYPYKYLEVYNNLGNSAEFKYEYGILKSGKGTLIFQVGKISYPIAQAYIKPTIYLNESYSGSNKYALNYSSFPTCGFASDTYKAWWAQNKNTYMASQQVIGNNYDTNNAIANINYRIAKNSANATLVEKLTDVETNLTNATGDYLTSMTNYGGMNQVNLTKAALELGIGTAEIGTGMVLTGSGTAPSMGTAMMAQGASIVTSGGVSGAIQSAINQTKINTASTAYSNAKFTQGNNALMAQNQYDTALKNAELSRSASQLSNANTYFNETAQLLAKKEDMTHMPNTAKGNAISDTMNYVTNSVSFIFTERQIPKEYAKIVDDYFDKYGYAWRSLYTPKRQNRKHWSYLKTVGCNIKGNINQTDLEVIRGIYDNGITTWNNLEEVGDYTLDNTI